MVKVIFSDFDNTLMDYYSDKNYFDDYQIEVLRKVKEKGIKFCIVTGRCMTFFKQFPRLLEVVDYILASNGASIYDVKNNSFIYHNSIEESELDRLIDYLIKNDYPFLLNCLDKRYQYGEWNRGEVLPFKEGEKYQCEQLIMSFPKVKSDEVANFVEYLDNVIVNNVTDWGDTYSADVNVKSVSKGNAIGWLCANLGIEKEDTIGFGDGDNDISMFESVGHGIAMMNASEKVKSMANVVTLSVVENGVYKYIEDNILK